MAIIGFLFLVVLAVYCTLWSVGLLQAFAAYGCNHTTDAVAFILMVCVAVTLWTIAVVHAPFHITFS